MLFVQLFLFILLYFHTILALFVVTAPKSSYTARYGGKVQMKCSFPVPKEDDLNKLKVSWKHFPQRHHEARQVTMFNNGRENISSQENMYKGRARLLVQELKNGEAILQIEEVRPTDAGTYLCLLQLGAHDHQAIKLNVEASYSNITTSSHISQDNEISLTCESLGFPKAEVYWKKNGVNISSPVNTSHSQTTDGLYKVRSTIQGIDMNQSYNCVFWNNALMEETQASPKHSGLVGLSHGSNYNRKPQRNDSGHLTQELHIVIMVAIAFIVIILVAAVIIFLKKNRRCFKCFKKKDEHSFPL